MSDETKTPALNQQLNSTRQWLSRSRRTGNPRAPGTNQARSFCSVCLHDRDDYPSQARKNDSKRWVMRSIRFMRLADPKKAVEQPRQCSLAAETRSGC